MRPAVTVLIAVVVIIVALLFLLTPRLEPFLLKKGLQYAQEKVSESLPSVEGYNPTVHAEDPLEIEADFHALVRIVAKPDLATAGCRAECTQFMKLFRDFYGDQTISPAELADLHKRLNAILAEIVNVRFPETARQYTLWLADHDTLLSREVGEVAGEALAGLDDTAARPQLLAPFALEFAIDYRLAAADSLTSTESRLLHGQMLKMRRFQTYAEFEPARRRLVDLLGSRDYDESARLLDYLEYMRQKIRDTLFEYEPLRMDYLKIASITNAQQPEDSLASLLDIMLERAAEARRLGAAQELQALKERKLADFSADGAAAPAELDRLFDGVVASWKADSAIVDLGLLRLSDWTSYLDSALADKIISSAEEQRLDQLAQAIRESH